MRNGIIILFQKKIRRFLNKHKKGETIKSKYLDIHSNTRTNIHETLSEVFIDFKSKIIYCIQNCKKFQILSSKNKVSQRSFNFYKSL